MVTLRTQRLLLIALTRDQIDMALNDVNALARALNITITPGTFSDESRQAMTIKLTRMDYVDTALHPWFTYFLLVNAAERTAVGVCGFKGSPNVLGSAELGYAAHPNHRNKGYMTEAVRALIEWAFTQEPCKVVIAETLRENIASQRVLQKAGMVFDRAVDNMLYWKVPKPEDR